MSFSCKNWFSTTMKLPSKKSTNAKYNYGLTWACFSFDEDKTGKHTFCSLRANTITYVDARVYLYLLQRKKGFCYGISINIVSEVNFTHLMKSKRRMFSTKILQ